MGDTKVERSRDNGNGNLILAQQATLQFAGTLQSLSFDVRAASGNLILGVYDATGPGGGPGNLIAETASFKTVVGWNTQPVAKISIPAGTYWLAYLPSSNLLGFWKQNTSGNCWLYGAPFSAGMPAAWNAASQDSCTPTTWSFYATLSIP